MENLFGDILNEIKDHTQEPWQKEWKGMRRDPIFEHLGYFKEYYIDSKLIGSVRCEKDRELIGYAGRKHEIIIHAVILDNKKQVKAGVVAMTMIYPLNGKVISR